MKKFCKIVLLCAFWSFYALFAQNQNTTFIHGYGSSQGTWTEMRSYLNSVYRLSLSNDISLNTSTSVPTTATQLQNMLNQSGNLAIAHSMGGLYSRQLIRQHGASAKIAKLITVGTPHQGARIAGSIKSGELTKIINWLISDLDAGPKSVIPAYAKIKSLLGVPSGKAIKGYIEMNAADAGAVDVTPSSAFLNTLNSSSGLSSETYMRAGIWSAEDYWRPVRMASTAITGSTFESAEYQGMSDYYYAAVVWAKTANYCYSNSYYWLSAYMATGNLWYYAYSVAWAVVGNRWARGWYALAYWFPDDWDYATGAIYKKNNNWYWDYSDALIPARSQAFPVNNSINWKGNHYILYANHLQETTHQNAKDKLKELLGVNYFNIPKR